MREFSKLSFWEKRAILVTIGTVLMTITGPFGTFETLPFVTRGLFFAAVMIGVGLSVHIHVMAAVHMPFLGNTPRSLRVIVGAIIAAIPGTVIVVFVDAVLHPPAMTSDYYLVVFCEVAFVSVLISVFEYGVIHVPFFGIHEDRENSASEFTKQPMSDSSTETLPEIENDSSDETGRSAVASSPSADDTPGDSDASQGNATPWPFMKRLKPELGQELISLSMQDHYVEATTTRGSQMILMRMSDALKELDGYDGMRIHRSHWAASTHMMSLARKGNKTLLTLSDGRDLPVSATYLDRVKARL